MTKKLFAHLKKILDLLPKGIYLIPESMIDA